MAVLAVVPGKECLAMASGVFDAAKALREVGMVFHGLELRLRIRVVIRGAGRLWLLATSRSINKLATGLERMEVPRSACSVSAPGSTS